MTGSDFKKKLMSNLNQYFQFHEDLDLTNLAFETRNLRTSDKITSHKKPRLLLIMDIDLTMVQSVVHSCPAAADNNSVDYEKTPLKIRPRLFQMLKQLKPLIADIWVDTLSSRSYAEAILKRMDPEEEFFNSKERLDCVELDLKKTDKNYFRYLHKIKTEYDSLVVIDDNPRVWNIYCQASVLSIDQFLYYQWPISECRSESKSSVPEQHQCIFSPENHLKLGPSFEEDGSIFAYFLQEIERFIKQGIATPVAILNEDASAMINCNFLHCGNFEGCSRLLPLKDRFSSYNFEHKRYEEPNIELFSSICSSCNLWMCHDCIRVCAQNHSPENVPSRTQTVQPNFSGVDSSLNTEIRCKRQKR